MKCPLCSWLCSAAVQKLCRHLSTRTANNPRFSQAHKRQACARTQSLHNPLHLNIASHLGLRFQPSDPMNCRLPESDSLSDRLQVIFPLLRMPLGLCVFSQNWNCFHLHEKVDFCQIPPPVSIWRRAVDTPCIPAYHICKLYSTRRVKLKTGKIFNTKNKTKQNKTLLYLPPQNWSLRPVARNGEGEGGVGKTSSKIC